MDRVGEWAGESGLLAEQPGRRQSRGTEGGRCPQVEKPDKSRPLKTPSRFGCAVGVGQSDGVLRPLGMADARVHDIGRDPATLPVFQYFDTDSANRSVS